MAEMAQCLRDVGSGPLAVHPGERGRRSRVLSSEDSGWQRSGCYVDRPERYRLASVAGRAHACAIQEGEAM
jgi:hypothetical protein